MVSDNGAHRSSSRWCFENYYHDEPIASKLGRDLESLPEPLRAARALENTVSRRNVSRSRMFFDQARLLADYEDDYEYSKNVVRYYPTYQALGNQELRGYFSWRAKWRKGNLQKTSLSFAFIYIYELLHLIGCSDPYGAYEKLSAFARDYAKFDSKISSYLKKWLMDFVVYYKLNPAMLSDTKQTRKDNALHVLLEMGKHSDAKIFRAALELAGSTLQNSRFYKTNPKPMEHVVVNILRRLEAHYEKSCKKKWVENYFGDSSVQEITPFYRAVFYDRNKDDEQDGEDTQVQLTPLCYYRRIKGRWYLYRFDYNPSCRKKFLNLIRTIDSKLRRAADFPFPMEPKIKTKWLLDAINEEIQRWQEAERRTKKKKLNLDLSQLGTIRTDAGETREKLLTEEEVEEISESPPHEPESEEIADDNFGFNSLSPQEKRYLQCILKGSSTNWIADEGLLSSLLCDKINEKLYDIFEDNVLENGELVEDYREELKKEFAS